MSAMSTWRFLGEVTKAITPAQLRNQSLHGWSPWEYVWISCEPHRIVVPDPIELKRFRHVSTYRVTDGKLRKFAVDQRGNGVWRFYVPASAADNGAFEARIPRYEGFWRSRQKDDGTLPWPEGTPEWPERAAFLDMLDRADAEAEKVAYRGYSHCRICGCRNGFQSLRLDVWEWPSGFRHYLADHEVRPSRDFEVFVQEYASEQV